MIQLIQKALYLNVCFLTWNVAPLNTSKSNSTELKDESIILFIWKNSKMFTYLHKDIIFLAVQDDQTCTTMYVPTWTRTIQPQASSLTWDPSPGNWQHSEINGQVYVHHRSKVSNQPIWVIFYSGIYSDLCLQPKMKTIAILGKKDHSLYTFIVDCESSCHYLY